MEKVAIAVAFIAAAAVGVLFALVGAFALQYVLPAFFPNLHPSFWQGFWALWILRSIFNSSSKKG